MGASIRRKRGRWAALVILAGAAACTAAASGWFQSEGSMQYTFHNEPRVLDEAARVGASGDFITLSDGVTHYEVAGLSDGPAVVLVHGFSVPAYIWDRTASALAAAGYRVVRYDLFGRGLSDRPEATCDLELYDRQLVELVEGLGLRQPVDVVGVSLGGLITARFGERHPEMVRRLALIAPAGMLLDPPVLARVVTAPLVGELMMDYLTERMLVDTIADDFYRPQDFPEVTERYRPQMEYSGFRRCVLDTLRYGSLVDHRETYRRLGRMDVPILLIWGQEDTTVPFRVSQTAQELMPRAELHAIPEARHFVHYERPEAVNPLLIAFLGR